MEGALRGDKGIRDENEMPTLGYFKRALGLARPHWPYFLAAFCCLAVANAARIALPNFTGGILDRCAAATTAAAVLVCCCCSCRCCCCWWWCWWWCWCCCCYCICCCGRG